MTPCPHCDQAAVVDDGCCVHCGANRSGEQDFTDERFVLGAVFAQLEDLPRDGQRRVLTEALAQVSMLQGVEAGLADIVARIKGGTA